MFRGISVGLIVIFTSLHLFAQKDNVTFNLGVSKKNVQNLYNGVKVIDSREKTENLGYVQVGMGNRLLPVVASESMEIQLKNYFNSMKPATSSEGEFVIQMRKIQFAEVTTAGSEEGFGRILISFYCINNNKYYLLGTYDTLIDIYTGLDVTRRLLSEGSEALKTGISNYAVKKPDIGMSYSLDQLKNVDSIEKSLAPLYSAARLTDGYYETFTDFRNQKPNFGIEVETADYKDTYYLVGPDGKKHRVKRFKDAYAVVVHGKGYLLDQSNNLLALEREGDDFCCNMKVQESVKNGDAILAGAAGIMFGAIGGAIAGASINSEAQHLWKVKIDHLSGNFVKVKRLD